MDFIVRLRKLQISQGFTNDAIFAIDETACWMDMPADTTVEVRGSRSVSVKTTGHEKNHFTVVLTAKADGTKLKPFLVFKGKGTRLMKDLSTIPGVVRFSSNGCVVCSLTSTWFPHVGAVFTNINRLQLYIDLVSSYQHLRSSLLFIYHSFRFLFDQQKLVDLLSLAPCCQIRQLFFFFVL